MLNRMHTAVVVAGLALVFGTAMPVSAAAQGRGKAKVERKAQQNRVKEVRKIQKEQQKSERKELKAFTPDHRWDRNGNGVITRDEWRGDFASFDFYDRNRNGVVSIGELRGRRIGQRR